MDPVVIQEVVQVGDVFMVHFRCPRCNEKRFEGLPLGEGTCCGLNLHEAPLMPPSTRSGFRVVTGTKRKPKSSIGKRAVRIMYDYQEGLCAYCGTSIRDGYHIEHIVPVSIGGTNNILNLCLSCAPCNLVASSLYFKSFDLKRAYILQRRQEKSKQPETTDERNI